MLIKRTKRVTVLKSGVRRLTEIEQHKWINAVSNYVKEVPERMI